MSRTGGNALEQRVATGPPVRSSPKRPPPEVLAVSYSRSWARPKEALMRRGTCQAGLAGCGGDPFSLRLLQAPGSLWPDGAWLPTGSHPAALTGSLQPRPSLLQASSAGPLALPCHLQPPRWRATRVCLGGCQGRALTLLGSWGLTHRHTHRRARGVWLLAAPICSALVPLHDLLLAPHGLGLRVGYMRQVRDLGWLGSALCRGQPAEKFLRPKSHSGCTSAARTPAGWEGSRTQGQPGLIPLSCSLFRPRPRFI